MENNDKFKSPEETSGIEPTNSTSYDLPPSDKTQVVYYDAYDHGFTNGILKIPKGHFEQFIDFSAKRNLAQKELGITLNELKQYEQQLSENKGKLLQLNNLVAQSEHELEHIQAQQVQEYTFLQDTQHQKQTLVNQKEAIYTEYNLFNAVFFILIGFVFVLTDVLVTFDVLQYGLNMGYFNAIVLAIAVSSITFVIKPTIDRIFEKPYLDGQRKRQNRLLVTVSVLAIGVLGCLGYFREEYFAQKQKVDAAKRQIEAIDDKIKVQEESLNTPSSLENTKRVSELESTIKDLKNQKETQEKSRAEINQSTRSHPLLYVIFTMCNILFALAGAICLSIAFPVLDRIILKKSLKKLITATEEKEKTIYSLLEKLAEQQKNAKDRKSESQNNIALLPDLMFLENKIDDLKKTAKELLKFAAQNSAFAESALYNEAYERGLICEFNEKIIITPHQVGSFIRRNTNSVQSRGPRQGSDYSTTRDRENTPKDDRYLHQQIRNLIEYNHQNKKHALNGEEH